MRPENMKMKKWLEENGIEAMPKWIPTGSLKKTWRLYNLGIPWTETLANKLNGLGFTNYDNHPLDKFDGNGGRFSVFVRGHEEFLINEVS